MGMARETKENNIYLSISLINGGSQCLDCVSLSEARKTIIFPNPALLCAVYLSHKSDCTELYPAPSLASRMFFSGTPGCSSQSSQGEELYSFVWHSSHSLLSVRNDDEESVANILLFTQSTPLSGLEPPRPRTLTRIFDIFRNSSIGSN